MNKDGVELWFRLRDRWRKHFVLLLAFAAILNAVIRFWGEWEYFFGALLGHYFFWQALQAFFYDRTMFFGPGSASMEDGAGARVFAAILAFTGYFAMFFFNGYPWVD